MMIIIFQVRYQNHILIQESAVMRQLKIIQIYGEIYIQSQWRQLQAQPKWEDASEK